MGEKKMFWLRLPTDIFQDKVMKRLRNLPAGADYCCVTLKLMLLALKTDCRLTYDGLMDTFAEELALEIDEQPESVDVTLRYLISVGWFKEMSETEIFAEKSNELAGSESESKERVRKYRERQKDLLNQEKTLQLTLGSVTCNATVTPVTLPVTPEMLHVTDGNENVTIEKNRIEEKRKEKTERRSSLSAPPPQKVATENEALPENESLTFSNIRLSAQEISDLRKKFTPEVADSYIRRFSEFLEKSGKSYASHFNAISEQINRDVATGKTVLPSKDAMPTRCPKCGKSLSPCGSCPDCNLQRKRLGDGSYEFYELADKEAIAAFRADFQNRFGKSWGNAPQSVEAGSEST